MSKRPCLVFADEKGNIFDWPEIEPAGSSGGRWCRPRGDDWIPLPPGSELFVLPKRMPVGYDPRRKKFEILETDPNSPGRGVQAVAAFMAPAYTQICSAAYKTLSEAPILPLFSYTAVGWSKGRFVVAGLRVDPDERQDAKHVDRKKIERNALRRMSEEPRNRLLQHLGKCALTYGCPAARNLFMNRWEAPLPSSPACNARCLGCISLQERQDLCSTQERITFAPTPEEITGVAIPHLKEAPRAVVSFGQGCEGEPLLQAENIGKSIAMMRRATNRGTINLNTNGSLPDKVEALCGAGLDSIRVSINSCRPRYFEAYHRPKGYAIEDLKRSIRAVKASGGFASINYLMLPGVTDEEEEFQELCRFIDETGLDLIQMRNLNIDPEWCLKALGYRPGGKILGVRPWMARVREKFPNLRFGYFNPFLDPDTDK
jgi:pyruvate-formate lyase-activating enzyme